MRKNYRTFSKKIARFGGLCYLPVLSSVFLFFAMAGIVRAGNGPEIGGEEWLAVQACDVFQESNGVVVVQAETKTASGWAKKSDGGSGYLEWNGKESFNRPSAGKITYKIKFNTPGIYRFIWRSKINQGSDRAEHNDTWLKFPNNSNITFFGHKRGAGDVEADLKAKRNVVFPKGSGMSPAPHGASTDGWFKAYMNKLGWTWDSFTSDHNPHFIYVQVKKAGTYDMEIAARSYKHAIDGMILYHIGKKGKNLSNSVLDNLLKSVKDCSDIPTDPTPSNSAPTISAITNKTVKEGQTAKATVNASDADGDAISLSVEIKKGKNTVSSKEYTFVSKNKGKRGELTFPTQKGDAGEYQVTVSAGDGKGSSTKAFKITVTKAGDPAPDPEPEPDPDPAPGGGKITIYLVNANNNQDIKALENNASFATGNVGIRAAVNGDVPNGVRFILTGGPNNMSYRNKEGEQAPYSLFDDKGKKILPWKNIKAGKYKLVVEVLGTNASKTINFTVTGGGNEPAPKPEPGPAPGDDKIAIYLVNANNNQDIKVLEDNASFGVGVVSIRAATTLDAEKGVRFTLTGGPNDMRYRNKEGAIKPHSLFGDIGTKILPWKNIKAGKYKLVVEVLGTSASKTINFTVTGGNNARVAQASSKEETTVAPAEDQLYSDFKIARLYPNPVAEELTVEYTGLAAEENINLQLVNRLGVVYSLDAQSYQIDGNTIKVNMSGLNLSAGVYILKVENTASGKAEVFRLIKY